VSGAVDLREVVPSGRVKGYANYSARGNAKTARRIIDLYEEMSAADALPLGPRQAGYRLKELFPGEYDKRDFKTVEGIVKRLGQASELPFQWIADASAVSRDPGGYDDPSDYLRNLPLYARDLRQRQAEVVEVYAEARETLPLITRVAYEYGVHVYSGGGSAGPKLAEQVASRAVRRAVERGQSTRLLGIADFDDAGIRRVLRPHTEHVSAFLYGTDGRGRDSNGDLFVVSHEGDAISSITAVSVTFKQLLLTAEDALEMVESPEDRERIEEYLASGDDLWSRDLECLSGVQKIETEALDPRDLRDRFVRAIESILDLGALQAVKDLGQGERETMNAMLLTLGGGQFPGDEHRP
jgi:hypothetical protein